MMRHFSVSRSTIAGFSATVAFALWSSFVWAQCETKYVPTEGHSADQFGSSISASQNTAIIGAPKTVSGDQTGAAYIFQRQGESWIEIARLLPFDGQNLDEFGASVDIQSETGLAVVGAPDAGIGGAAYVYRGTQLEAKLTLRDEEASDRFGCAVAIDDDWIVVGARGKDDQGSAYVFKFDGSAWKLFQEFRIGNEHGANFGVAVDIQGDRLLIAADSSDMDSEDGGVVYSFRYGGGEWQLDQTLVPTIPVPHQTFGTSLVLSGDRLVIGASGLGDSFPSGVAYVFESVDDRWIERDILTSSDGQDGDAFGSAVAMSQLSILVGAPDALAATERSGAAYLYKLVDSVWIQATKMTPSDGGRSLESDFGGAIALLSDQVMVGKRSRGIALPGALYTYPSQLRYIIRQPADQIINSGEQACFEVEVGDGIGDVQYQWRRNGKNLTDFGTIHGSQTDMLCISEVFCADQGVYDVVVADDCGPIVSEPAMLEVESPPALYADATCPTGGPMSISWDCATPGGMVAVIFAAKRGSVRIPNKYFCPGTQLDLGAQAIQLFYLGPAGPAGRKTIYGSASPFICGGYLQLVDLRTCETSNPVHIQ